MTSPRGCCGTTDLQATHEADADLAVVDLQETAPLQVLVVEDHAVNRMILQA